MANPPCECASVRRFTDLDERAAAEDHRSRFGSRLIRIGRNVQAFLGSRTEHKALMRCWRAGIGSAFGKVGPKSRSYAPDLASPDEWRAYFAKKVPHGAHVPTYLD